jgi:hypothetical protein
MSAKKSEIWLDRTIALARAFSEGHSSDTERDEAIRKIDAMMRELQEIREHLNALPSEAERRRIGDAATVMEQFLDTMKARPAVALAMGLGVQRSQTNSRPQRELPVVEAQKTIPLARGRADVTAIIAELEQLTTENIQTRLLDEAEFPFSRLQHIARQLGVSTERGRDRLDLIDRIVKLGFANKRGYDLLGRPRKAAP